VYTYTVDGTSATANFGTAAELVVKKASTAGSNRESYLRFDLSSVPSVGAAKLRLFGRLGDTSTPGVVTTVYSADNTAWSESGLTWNTKPAAGTAARGSVTVSGTTGKWYELDLTTFLAAEKAAGRDPREIRRIANVSGRFGSRDGGFLDGPPAQWVEQLLPVIVDDGVGTVVLASDDADSIETFAGEVVPALCEAVAAERAERGTETGTIASSFIRVQRHVGIDYDSIPATLAADAVEPGDAAYVRLRSNYMRGGNPGLGGLERGARHRVARHPLASGDGLRRGLRVAAVRALAPPASARSVLACLRRRPVGRPVARFHGAAQLPFANGARCGPWFSGDCSVNTVANRVVLPAAQSPITGALAELERRQPQLASVARLFLLAAIPCLIAMIVDSRTVNDVSGWIKPTKFFVSLALYFATLAWYFGYLPQTAQRS
jgi:hypothetical protein